jgi:mannose-6-phosphate isomerase-like protein (cupin superfamily)
VNPINLRAKCDAIEQPWTPRIVGDLNGQHVKIALLKGEFIWHRHDDADELFLVLRGSLRIKYRPPEAGETGGTGEGEREVQLAEGEMFIVPRGVEHLPIADAPCYVMLFEPAGTLNTGNVRSALTVDDPVHG